MPAWFLRLWIAAQGITGQYYVTVANGIFQFVSVVGGYFLASGTASASPAYPTANGLNSIDIQTTRISTGARALSPRDVVIGSESGTVAGVGSNVLMGATTRCSSTGGNNILLGSNCTVSKTGAGQIDNGGNVIIGSSVAAVGANGVTVIGSGISFAMGLNFSVGDLVIIGGGGGINFDATGDVSGLAVIGAYCGAAGLPNGSAVLGTGSVVGAPGVVTNGACVIGVGSTLQDNNTTRVSNGNGGSQAAIDIVSGVSVNTSLVKLGVAPAGSADLPGGANTAYAFALADQGKGIVASAAAVTLANNRTLNIITGTTNGTITMPANPIEGQIVRIAFDSAIASVTIAANTGHTIRNTLTAAAAAAGSSVEFTFNLAANGGTANAWYRTR